MKRTLTLVLCSALLIASGCVRPVIMAPTNQEKSFTPTNETTITISTVPKTDKPNVELGYVYSQEKSLKDAEQLAREEAAKMGGNAIIGATTRAQVMLTGFILFFPVYETFYIVHGTVVRFE